MYTYRAGSQGYSTTGGQHAKVLGKFYNMVIANHYRVTNYYVLYSEAHFFRLQTYPKPS